MVKVIATEKRTSADGRKFNVLILQGGIDVVKSKRTGKSYLTAHKVSMVCTLDEVSAREQVGAKLPGTVQKIACEPYAFKVPQTGETVQLDYTFQYSPESVSMEESVFA